MDNHYILIDDEPVLERNVKKWSDWFRTMDKTVAFDTIVSNTATSRISTVFLGVAEGYSAGRPNLWETLVLNGPLAGQCLRYATKAAALAGHEAFKRNVGDFMGAVTEVAAVLNSEGREIAIEEAIRRTISDAEPGAQRLCADIVELIEKSPLLEAIVALQGAVAFVAEKSAPASTTDETIECIAMGAKACVILRRETAEPGDA